MFRAPRCQLFVNRTRNGVSLQCIESAVSPSPSRWLACSGLRRLQPPAPPALVTISGATSSYPLVSLLAAKYVKLHPEQGQLQDRAGRHHGRHQRRQNRQRHDRRRRAGTDQRRRRPGLLPDRQVRDLRRHEQVQHRSATSPQAQVTSIFTGKTKTWSDAARRHRDRPDRSVHPHVGRRRADELQVAAAGRQERRVQRDRRGDRGSDAPGGRKRTPAGSASCPTTRPTKAASTRSTSTASPATRRPRHPGSTPAWPSSTRSPKAPPGAPRRRSSTGSTHSGAAKKIIASQWIPIG